MLNSLYVFLCLIALVWAIIEYFRTKDEVPLFLAAFTGLTINRLFLLESGEAEWVAFDYGINFIFNMEYAYIVSDLILLGTFVFLLSYLFTNKNPRTVSADDTELFSEFVSLQKNKIIYGFIFFFLFSFLMRGSLSMGYGFLLTLANSSFIILLFLAIKKADTTSLQKAGLVIFMGILAYATYNPGLRFQFLGWSIPIMIFLLKDFGPLKRGIYYLAGGFIVLIFFSMAGALRNPENIDKPISEIYEEGKGRLFEAEDINFIDGFIMLYQVYPEYLDYHYGLDHLGILLRPVPRSWWPGKPNGGWHQKYADKYNYGEEFGTGISTTIYGVFYGEGGVVGIIICSVLWGIGLAKLVKLSNSFNSDIQNLIKGMIMASLIPIMRSGDLAGDFAIVGMSYWPIFLFLYQYKKFLKEKRELTSEIQHDEAEDIVS